MSDLDPQEEDTDEPRRWRDAPPSAPEEAEIGAALRRVDAEAEVGELRLAQIRQQILRRLPVRGAPARYRVRTMAIAIVALIAGSVATALGERLIRRWSAPAVAPPAAPASVAPSASPTRRSRRLAARVAAASDVEAESTRELLQEPLQEPSQEPSDGFPPSVASPPGASPPVVEVGPPVATAGSPPRRFIVPGARSRVAETASDSAHQSANERANEEAKEGAKEGVQASLTAVEAAVLADALRLVRQSGDPRGALARLDEHDRRFPDGPLAREALLARVEALLMLDDHQGAVRLLDGLSGDAFPADGRLDLLRGDLRARVGRCVEAIADFDRALAGTPGLEVAARARAARARCLETFASPRE